MDQTTFDRITRLLGGASTRRQGIAAALGAAMGLTAGIAAETNATAGDAAKGRGKGAGSAGTGSKHHHRPSSEGPCGDGSRKANQCSKNSQCCTGICNTKPGKKNLDGKGRCRCLKKGTACKADKNCCNTMKCVNGACRNGSSGPVPNGGACVAGSDTCADENASCTEYDPGSGGPSGTYCLLPVLETSCTAGSDCACNSCYGNTCISCGCGGCPSESACAAPEVCASGCTHSKVQDAIDAANDGDTITIGTGTYAEDLTITGKSLTLLGCPTTGDVTLVNETYGTRTINVTDGSDLTIGDIVISGYNIVASTTFGGGISFGDDQGERVGTLCIGLRSRVENCYNNAGAGIFVAKAANQASGKTVSIHDCTILQDNVADSYAGAIHVDTYNTLVVDGHVKFLRNTAPNNGGAIYSSYDLDISGNVEFSENHSQYGGAIKLWMGNLGVLGNVIKIGGKVVFKDNTSDYGGAIHAANTNTCGQFMVISGDVSFTGNSAVYQGGAIFNDSTGLILSNSVKFTGNLTTSDFSDTYGGGAIYYYEYCNTTYILIQDDVEISGNTSASQGGGLMLPNTTKLTLSGNAVIKDNKATDNGAGYGGYGGGVYFSYDGNEFSITGNASITGNSADNDGGGIAIVGPTPLSTTDFDSQAITGNTPSDCIAGNSLNQVCT